MLTDGLGNVLADVVGVDNLLIDGNNGDDTIMLRRYRLRR